MTANKKDALGDRMKGNFESRSRHYFPRRTYTFVRVDGRAFHTWTRGLNKPYDLDFMSCMDAAAIQLCQEMSGAQLAFVQSDEITILMTDFDSPETQAWFDGGQSKIESVSASIATMAFNLHLMKLINSGVTTAITKKTPNVVFDSRAWVVPDYIEVENTLIWRQKDAERNSVTLLASHYASHKKLHGKSTSERHEIIHEAGDNWAKHPVRFKYGGVIRRSSDNEWGKDLGQQPYDTCYSVGTWFVDHNTPVFTREREYLKSKIPRHWESDFALAKGASNVKA